MINWFRSDSWKNLRPYLAGGILICLNVDWVLVNVLRWYTDSLLMQFFILAPIATVEIIGWFYVWRWYFNRPNRPKEPRGNWLTNWVRKLFKKLSDPNRRIYKILTSFGRHFGLFILGSEPVFMGGRLAGTVICAKLQNGTALRALFTLCFANLFHVAYTVGFWELFYAVLHMWGTQ